MLDLNLIRVFVAVVEEGTLTAAAARLNLTQPSITHAVNRLRRATGDDLFRRSGRGVQATPAALQLYAEIARLPREADAAVARLAGFDPATTTATFRLAVTDLGLSTFLPLLMAALRESAPRAQLDIRPLDTDTSAADLEAGELDLAIASIPLQGRIRSVPIREDRYVGISRAGRFSGPPTLEDITEEPRVVIRGTTGHQIVESRLPEPPPGSVTVDSFAGIPALLSQTDLMAFVPGIVVSGWASRWPVEPWELPLSDVEATVYAHAFGGRPNAATEWFVEWAIEELLSTPIGADAGER
ncbi:LysR family transcriptional regulator [Citricoccus sp. GCM10030269]|uniref:LysR family transcriptional regulator n=1 Tax=Citricoccus sp. GCM10030269 TaxID=3273388 RepID=UPI00360AD566